MPARIVIPIDAEIAAAFAGPPPKREPRATAVSYRPARDEGQLGLTDAVTLLVPRAAADERRGVDISVRGLTGFESPGPPAAYGSTGAKPRRSRLKAPAV